ncbi:MAG: hypothetical protein HZB68_03360 [Candidatus Aenigmarchaeota archaeon]|nr:hypothetical protein [Candidatus Aenigmarchaeota archaeon]
MGIITRTKKDAIGITGVFSQTDALRVYLDAATALGMGDSKVYCGFHDDENGSNSVTFLCGTDSYGDSFEAPLFGIGGNEPHTVSELKELMGESGKVLGVRCRGKKQCKIVEREYSIYSGNDGEVPVCFLDFKAEISYDKKSWAVEITANSYRPNYYKTGLANIEVDLKGKLKKYGANVKLL